jgi:NADH-quinone oxidoreductase subunit H
VLLPLNLVWILALAAIKVAQGSGPPTRRSLLIAGGVLVVAAIVWLLLPSRDRAAEAPPADAGGFPIPPLDLQVPPSPRTKRVTAEREPVVVGGAGADASSEENDT